MRIAFFLGKRSELDHNTGLRVLEQLDDEKSISDTVEEIGYPLAMAISIARLIDPPQEDQILLIPATDGGTEVIKQFTQLILSYGTQYHGMTWGGEAPDNYILRRLSGLESQFPQMRVTGRQWYIHTFDVGKDLWNMIVNFESL